MFMGFIGGLSLVGLLYFALTVEGGGSFPKPLSPAEERECLRLIAEGDQQARGRLIEHNLRLVVHIIKILRHRQRPGRFNLHRHHWAD